VHRDRRALREIRATLVLRELREVQVFRVVLATQELLERLDLLAHLVQVGQQELMVCLEIQDLPVLQGLLGPKDLLVRLAAREPLDLLGMREHQDLLDSLVLLEVLEQ